MQGGRRDLKRLLYTEENKAGWVMDWPTMNGQAVEMAKQRLGVGGAGEEVERVLCPRAKPMWSQLCL